MYSEKLEKLIEHALADGVLMEKEKQVLLKNAEAEGVDPDEFEVILEARLYEKQQRQDGIIVKNEKGLQELLLLLEETEKEEKEKLEKKIEKLLKQYGKQQSNKEIANFAWSIIKGVVGIASGGISSVIINGVVSNIFKDDDENDEEKIEFEQKYEELKDEVEKHLKVKQQNIISSFPVPVSRDKILELLNYINSMLKNEEADEDIWESKFYGIISHAKMNFVDDKVFLTRVSEYEQQQQERENKKLEEIEYEEIEYERQQQKKKTMKTVIYAAVAVIIVPVVIFTGMWIYSGVQEHNKAKQVEKVRLEQVLDDINKTLKDNDLAEVESLVMTHLVWKYESGWGDCLEEKKTWDKKRKEILNTRLERMYINVNEAIKNHNLDEAEFLANQLEWKYKSDFDNCKEEKKTWDKKRKEILNTIHKIKEKENVKEEENIIEKAKSFFDNLF
jgi:hypothetical protein